MKRYRIVFWGHPPGRPWLKSAQVADRLAKNPQEAIAALAKPAAGDLGYAGVSEARALEILGEVKCDPAVYACPDGAACTDASCIKIYNARRAIKSRTIGARP